MPFLSLIASTWRNLSDKDVVDQELTEELRAHVDLLTDQKIREGLEPEAARRAALVEVGGIEQVKERVREVRMGRPLEDLSQDFRYALRGLRKHRALYGRGSDHARTRHRRQHRDLHRDQYGPVARRFLTRSPIKLVVLTETDFRAPCRSLVSELR